MIMENRISLDQVKWSKFKVSDIFTVENSKPYHKDRLEQYKYGVPYITRTSLNNGLEDTIKGSDFKFNKRDSISLGAENADFFYQPYNYIAGNKMYSISHPEINKSIGLFLVQAFRSSIKDCGFGYGKGLTGTRMKDRLVMLPIDSEGKPNWSFMEQYIKQEQKKAARKVIDYYEQKILETAFDLVGLENVEWREFPFNKIFRKIQRGKRLKKADHIDGYTPYISSTAMNNGLDGFIGNKDGVRKFSNNISIANSGSVGACFYHEYEYIASDHVTSLSIDNADKYIYLFMSTIVRRLEEKYSFNREINDKRIRQEKIILPVDENGNPHWEYMSQFMQNLEAEKVQEVLEHIYIYRLAILKESQMSSLNEKVWSEFWMEDIVSIGSGVRLTKANQEEGNRPFIGSSDSNNGVTEFVSNTNNSLDRNVLGVNYNGSVVENFYHPYEAIFSDDVKRIHWQDERQEDRYTYLFLKQAILQQKVKYAYGYKFNAGRMKRQKIMLPVKEDGIPDYDYMRQYIQIEEIKQSFKILDYYREI